MAPLGPFLLSLVVDQYEGYQTWRPVTGPELVVLTKFYEIVGEPNLSVEIANSIGETLVFQHRGAFGSIQTNRRILSDHRYSSQDL